MKYKNKWGMMELFKICSDYLNNQTEEESLNFLKKIEDYKKKYIQA